MRTLSPLAALDIALGAAAGVLALRLLAISCFILSMSDGRPGPWGFLHLTAGPLAFAAAAAGALLLRGRDGIRARWAAAASIAGLTVVLSAWPPDSNTFENELGLASQPAGASHESDYSDNPNKDAYPVCRFQYNSLGFRDVEPPAEPRKEERRVLLVGDSYVWGDGIPANEETLAYLLRDELARSAPGRSSVMSAAYPGLGVYGYGRFLDALTARYRPDVVVVGYLGTNDHDPFDAQFLLDHLPPWAPARNLLLNLGAVQHVHEASVRSASVLWRSARNEEASGSRLREMAALARARGFRLVFLSYFEHPPLPEPIETLDLPEALRYPGRSSELWYAKDMHPKTSLNRILARMLAVRLSPKEA